MSPDSLILFSRKLKYGHVSDIQLIVSREGGRGEGKKDKLVRLQDVVNNSR